MILSLVPILSLLLTTSSHGYTFRPRSASTQHGFCSGSRPLFCLFRVRGPAYNHVRVGEDAAAQNMPLKRRMRNLARQLKKQCRTPMTNHFPSPRIVTQGAVKNSWTVLSIKGLSNVFGIGLLWYVWDPNSIEIFKWVLQLLFDLRPVKAWKERPAGSDLGSAFVRLLFLSFLFAVLSANISTSTTSGYFDGSGLSGYHGYYYTDYWNPLS